MTTLRIPEPTPGARAVADRIIESGTLEEIRSVAAYYRDECLSINHLECLVYAYLTVEAKKPVTPTTMGPQQAWDEEYEDIEYGMCHLENIGHSIDLESAGTDIPAYMTEEPEEPQWAVPTVGLATALTYSPAFQPIRDQWVVDCMEQWQALIAAGGVQVNGVVTRTNVQVKSGDTLGVDMVKVSSMGWQTRLA